MRREISTQAATATPTSSRLRPSPIRCVRFTTSYSSSAGTMNAVTVSSDSPIAICLQVREVALARETRTGSETTCIERQVGWRRRGFRKRLRDERGIGLVIWPERVRQRLTVPG